MCRLPGRRPAKRWGCWSNTRATRWRVAKEASDGGRGWANAERPPFLQRVKPALVLCLAVIHHLVVSASIPPELVVGFLRSMAAAVVLEIPSIDDPMVTLLLDQKTNVGDYLERYDGNRISQALDREFMTVRREEIGTRTLLHLTPRP